VEQTMAKKLIGIAAAIVTAVSPAVASDKLHPLETLNPALFREWSGFVGGCGRAGNWACTERNLLSTALKAPGCRYTGLWLCPNTNGLRSASSNELEGRE
jgi:hypothetical protein